MFCLSTGKERLLTHVLGILALNVKINQPFHVLFGKNSNISRSDRSHIIEVVTNSGSTFNIVAWKHIYFDTIPLFFP